MAYVTHKKPGKVHTKGKGSWPSSDDTKIAKLADKAREAGKTSFIFEGQTYFICKDGEVRCWDCVRLDQIVR